MGLRHCFQSTDDIPQKVLLPQDLTAQLFKAAQEEPFGHRGVYICTTQQKKKYTFGIKSCRSNKYPYLTNHETYLFVNKKFVIF